MAPQHMTPYAPPQNQPIHPVKMLPLYVALTVCAVLILGGLGLSSFGLLKILDTTPFMGIPVDALGNPLPVEGYPQLCFGIAITVTFSVLALICSAYIFQKREDAVLSQLFAPVVPEATNNPMHPSGGSSGS